MRYNEFEVLLANASINKKEFAGLVDMNYVSITNWNKSQKIPNWVKSWLNNYIKAKSYEDVKDKVLQIEGIAK
jgi:hypothetical protein